MLDVMFLFWNGVCYLREVGLFTEALPTSIGEPLLFSELFGVLLDLPRCLLSLRFGKVTSTRHDQN